MKEKLWEKLLNKMKGDRMESNYMLTDMSQFSTNEIL